jgi:hypothetical protein
MKKGLRLPKVKVKFGLLTTAQFGMRSLLGASLNLRMFGMKGLVASDNGNCHGE